MANDKKVTTITANSDISRKITRYQNLDDNEIVITETRLENILMKHEQALGSGNDWKTPFGLIISIILVFLTAEFNKNFLGINKEMWGSLFIVVLIGSLIWLSKSLLLKYRNRNTNRTSLICSIKNEKRKNG